jgi:catechol 2,3-dioxygenase-like lactoylglutathione lyase family enzyme
MAHQSIRGIDHVGITVPDIEAATKFFKDAFGAKKLATSIQPTSLRLATPRTPEQRPMPANRHRPTHSQSGSIGPKRHAPLAPRAQ